MNDLAELFIHSENLRTFTPEQRALAAALHQAKADALEEEQRLAEESGDFHRRVRANRYNGDKVLALLYRGPSA